MHCQCHDACLRVVCFSTGSTLVSCSDFLLLSCTKLSSLSCPGQQQARFFSKSSRVIHRAPIRRSPSAYPVRRLLTRLASQDGGNKGNKQPLDSFAVHYLPPSLYNFSALLLDNLSGDPRCPAYWYLDYYLCHHPNYDNSTLSACNEQSNQLKIQVGKPTRLAHNVFAIFFLRGLVRRSDRHWRTRLLSPYYVQPTYLSQDSSCNTRHPPPYNSHHGPLAPIPTNYV